jgi:demethylmenaquinone methyltransferase/2-methoxy-6-polyprenyl-1,4-benzoquinol methylase
MRSKDREIKPDEAVRMTGNERLEVVQELFDGVSPRYDFINDLITLGRIDGWRRKALRSITMPEGASLLDVGTGTGWIPQYLERKRPDLVVTGVDVSQGMLDIARGKVKKSNLLLADATTLPFEDASFDLVVSAFVYRNIQDRPAALAEMARVLAPGGTLMLLDTFTPVEGSLVRPLLRVWLGVVAPLLVSPFADPGAYSYLGKTILGIGSPTLVRDRLGELGLVNCRSVLLELGVVAIVMANAPSNLPKQC